MKSHYLLLVLCLIGLTFSAQGQNRFPDDIVYLKNGSVIKGTIIEQVPNKSLTLQTQDGNTFVYDLNEVNKLARDINTSHNKTQGYLGVVDFGYGFGVGEWEVDRIRFSVVNGYQFNPYFGMGIGIGFNSYEYQWYNQTICEYTLPIFAHFRANLLKTDVTPFAAVNLGYNIALKEDNLFRGMLFEPTVGIAIRVSSSNQLTVGVCYALSNATYTNYNNNVHSVGLKIGITL